MAGTTSSLNLTHATNKETFLSGAASAPRFLDESGLTPKSQGADATPLRDIHRSGEEDRTHKWPGINIV